MPWLHDRIARDGPLTVEAFMRAALMDPEHGYYKTRMAVGAAGDFITAPEISQIFGELIGLWVALQWDAMGSPSRWRLIEAGPGRGTLMADALRSMKVVPGARDGLEVLLVEANPVLEKVQRERLAGAGQPVWWSETLEGLPARPTVLIANEFLDALPIQQFVRTGGRWCERCVGLAGPKTLAFMPGPEISAPVRAFDAAPDGAIFEMMSGAATWIENAARVLAPAPHVSLYVDYGYSGPKLGETLQAVAAHAHADPLADPGAHDLSAHVDFAQVTAAARACGLDVLGPGTQAEFLARFGALERLERLCAGKDAKTINGLQSGLARLMDPAGMGGRFKALVLQSPTLANPIKL